MIEKIVISLINKLLFVHKDTSQVFLSGGVFHNSKLVGEITRKINTKVLVSPSPGDSGSSIGAGYFAMLCLDKNYTNKNITFNVTLIGVAPNEYCNSEYLKKLSVTKKIGLNLNKRFLFFPK